MSVITLQVDEVMRTLSNDGQYPFVKNDKTVDIVRFALNTGFTDVTLDDNSALRVMYQRPGETEVRAQTLTYYDTDGLHNYYDWQLLSADLAEKGTLTVALCILRTGSEVKEWHTTPYQVRVLGSIHTDDSDEADETITPTVAQRVAVLESMIQRIASGAPIVVSSVSAMTDTEQLYVLSTNGNWYYYNGSAWVAGGEYGAVSTDTTLTQAGVPADAKAVGDALSNTNERLDELENGGVGWTSEQKGAVLAIARAVAYNTENGDQLYSDLYDALYAVRIRYTISNSLTHCTSNNNATSIMEGYNYLATITPSSGYELSAVQIMMGGANITTSAYENGTINIAEVTGNVVITATATKILPDGYTALEYVTADGGQYINTGIAETEIISAEYDFSLNADSRYGTGNHILSSVNVFMPFLRSTYTETDHARNLMVCNRGRSAATETAFQWSLNHRYAFKAFMGGTDNIVIDNAQVANIPVGNTLSAQNNLYLFAFGGSRTNAVYRFNGNLYSMRLYNSSGTLIHRYLPCLDSNNVAGLYDTVSQTFLHSESGTELIAGGVA